MLRSTILAVAAAGLMLASSTPASANAVNGMKANPGVATGSVIDVRGRGGRGGFFGRGGGGARAFRGGGARAFRGGGVRAFRGGGVRHYRHRGHRGHRGWRRGRGLYYAAPFVTYGYYSGRSCYWLKRKARRTGSRYWWRRYYNCRRYYY